MQKEIFTRTDFFRMSVKILHFSDTHERATPEDPGAFLDKRLLGILNSSFIRKNHYDTKRIAPAVEYILAEKRNFDE